jgi:hypothetical protein
MGVRGQIKITKHVAMSLVSPDTTQHEGVKRRKGKVLHLLDLDTVRK